MGAANSEEAGRSTAETIAVRVAIRLTAFAVLLFLVVSLARPFVGIVIWSAVLTIALFPVYEWLQRLLGGRGRVAAALVTIGALILVFGPVAAILSSLVASLETLAVALGEGELVLPDLPPALASHPLLTGWADPSQPVTLDQIELYLQEHGHALLGPGEAVLLLIAHLAGSVAVFATAVVVAGLLFVPARAIMRRVRDAALRLAGGARGKRFVDLAGVTTRQVARSVIGMALLQALATWVVLVVAGVPHAGLFTVAVLILSIVQVGALPILVPLVIWFWLVSSPGPAILFTAAMVVISVVEHALKPLVMGQGAETPMLVILLGVLTGTVAFGLPGLFLGPIVLAVFYELFVAWTDSPLPVEPANRD